MAYNTEGLSLVRDSLSGGGPREWNYDSADAFTTVRVDTYISDAEERGMSVGDLVHARQWTSWTDKYTYAAPVLGYQLAVVMAVNADGSADLSDGTAVAVTNTD